MREHEISVWGYCPMGCGPTLVLPENSRVTCCSPVCPDPTIVSKILTNSETEHVVVFSYDPQTRLNEFAIVHPLRERVGQIETCELHKAILALGVPPLPAGRYRAMRGQPTGRQVIPTPAVPGWNFERVDP